MLMGDREHAPSIIFMDEIDSIGSTRTESGSRPAFSADRRIAATERATASSGRRTIAESHSGQRCGSTKGSVPAGRRSTRKRPNAASTGATTASIGVPKSNWPTPPGRSVNVVGVSGSVADVVDAEQMPDQQVPVAVVHLARKHVHHQLVV